jgi:CMP-N-acetylneuraminic acid synthetase
MVEHTISLAQETGLFDEIIVSLDNHKYDANFSEKGVILHYRPSELGSDDASTIQVVKDVLKSISCSRLSKVCCIYPCTPLLNSRRIAEGFALLERFPDRFVFASQPLYSNPSRAFTVDNEGLNFMDAKSLGKKTQELRNYFMDAGQFYWGRFSTWTTSDSILNDKSIPLNLPKWETIDVDDEGDLQIALALRSMRKGTGL